MEESKANIESVENLTLSDENVSEPEKEFQPILDVVKKPKKRKRKTLKILLITFLGMLLSGIISIAIGWISITIEAEDKIAQELKKLEDAGISLNIDDYAPPAIPDEENAAIILLEAFKKLVNNDKLEENIEEFTKTFEFKEIKETEIKQFIEANTDCLGIVEKAIEKPNCRFKDESENQILNYAMQQYQLDILSVLKILIYKSFLETKAGDLETAIATCVLTLRLSGTVSNDFSTLSRAIMNFARRSTLKVLRFIMKSYSLDKIQCHKLIKEINKQLKLKDSGDALTKDCLYMVKYFDKIVETPWCYVSPFRKQDYSIILEQFYDFTQVMKIPDIFSYRKLCSWEDYDFYWKSYDYPKYAALSRFSYFDYYKSFYMPFALDITKLEIARAALGIQVYYNRHKKLPEDLLELGAEKILDSDPYDPFSEEGLKYVKIDDLTYKIYSISENLTDDGGVSIDIEDSENDLVAEATDENDETDSDEYYEPDDYGWIITINK